MPDRRSPFRRLLLCALAPLLIAAVQADGVTVYEPAAFADVAPATAMDMVARLPGFVVIEADADVRGYAGAQGNVLIDGARPTRKREDIEDLLERIPAGAVLRIELIRGGASGIDMAGHAMVANVVRRRDSAAETTVEAGLLTATDGEVGGQGRVEYGGRFGERTLDLMLTAEREPDEDSGPGRIRVHAPDGALLETGATSVARTVDEIEASVAWGQPLAGGRLTLTAAAAVEESEEVERIRMAGEPEGVESSDGSWREVEVGGRFVRELSGGATLELLTSHQRSRFDSTSLWREGADTGRFDEQTEAGESIVRADLARSFGPRLSLTAGLEGAFNFLQGDARLEENGAVVPLPGSDVRIEERRAEANVDASWRPAGPWLVEGGLRVESSRISQTGDAPLERDFVYAKPRLAISHDAGGAHRFRLSLSREVGQLDFEDFVASASLASGVVTAGGADLAPDRTWRFVALWERRLGDDAALTLSWTHDRIEGVIDLVPVTSGGEVFDAPGNIGDGRRDVLQADLSTSLDRLGLGGFRLDTTVLWRASEVTDPTTGRPRPISGEPEIEGRIELRQSLPEHRVQWGARIDLAERERDYRVDEVRTERDGAGWGLFVERRIGDRWRLRAEVEDLFGRDFSETRDKHDVSRAAGPLEEIERRRREAPGRIGLTLRRSTGG